MAAAPEVMDPSLERSFRGHHSSVTGAAFSPTMKQCCTCSADASIMVWKFKPQLRALRFLGHKSEVHAVAYSPTGHLIASASKDSTVRIWVPNIEGESTLLKAHTAPVRSVQFSPYGKHLLTASQDKTLKVWSVSSKVGSGRGGLKFECTLQGHNNWVRSAKWSPDSRLIVSGGDDKTVKIWDLDRRLCTHTFNDHSNIVQSVAVHPDGTVITSTGSDSTIKLWDTRTRKLIQNYAAHSNIVNCVCFHPSGNYLLSASADCTLKIWDLREGRLFYTMHGHQNSANFVTFSPEGEYFLSCGSDKLTFVWKTNFDMFDDGVEGLFEDLKMGCRNFPVKDRNLYAQHPLGHFTATDLDCNDLSRGNLNQLSSSGYADRCNISYSAKKKSKYRVLSEGSAVPNFSSQAAPFAENVDNYFVNPQEHYHEDHLSKTLDMLISKVELLSNTVVSIEKRVSMLEDKINKEILGESRRKHPIELRDASKSPRAEPDFGIDPFENEFQQADDVSSLSLNTQSEFNTNAAESNEDRSGSDAVPYLDWEQLCS